MAAGSVALADEVRGTDQNDALSGTAGDDSLIGLAGNDTLDGLNGNDTIDGGPGADDMTGGRGRDVAVYGDAPAAVTVTIDDDLANDGVPGEHDNVQTDIEDLAGSAFDDQLSGSSGPNSIAGAAGNDVLTGLGGIDSLFGDDGNDQLRARDGVADTLDCGSGQDIAVADEHDTVTNCEFVDRDRADPIATATISHFWRATGSSTQVVELEASSVSPRSAKVQVRCKGGGCPFASKSFTPSGGRADLLRSFRRKRLRAGGSLEVRILAPGRTAKVLRFSIQRGKIPSRKLLCLKPGASKPSATGCPTF